jgi:hypothetical protein
MCLSTFHTTSTLSLTLLYQQIFNLSRITFFFRLSDASSAAHELILNRKQLPLPFSRILAKQPGCESFKNYPITTFFCFVSYQPTSGVTHKLSV